MVCYSYWCQANFNEIPNFNFSSVCIEPPRQLYIRWPLCCWPLTHWWCICSFVSIIYPIWNLNLITILISKSLYYSVIVLCLKIEFSFSLAWCPMFIGLYARESQHHEITSIPFSDFYKKKSMEFRCSWSFIFFSYSLFTNDWPVPYW